MAPRLIYLHGLAGGPELSPAVAGLTDIDVIAPVLPGFDGGPGFEPPSDHLGWLTLVWDALDATGALPCPVIGASVGGMLAAELAVLRPEAVTRLALLAPLGLFDADDPGEDPFAVPGPARLPLLFSSDVPTPFLESFPDREPAEQLVARFLVQVAAASLVWPFPDRGLAGRLHRLTAPTLLVWGEADRIAPVALAERWPADERVHVPGAGHMVEWDAPEQVGSALQKWVS
ncbi:MAG TPA: alpha/beta fold hydrolase [Acidimicrobiales bacterium]|nr:alpha/beta fold hydrolase [Acidimicrobiales bacterium]